ncbi:sensor histidine kinase [Vallitalea guaymasensis]|uniref:histidine kinase n=1 Tax=Vallitalea guaymasensis TaxID=1185412 RepID=A0A8J8MD42_9FIRM|nr:sensor histidine kinase [Vallitalea guaymasensis]QUH30711.1 sensor histidine kinase [Vallitalea guaymasensis]
MKRIKIYHALRVKLGIIAIVLIALPVIAISITYSRTVKEIIKNKYTDTAIQSVFETGDKIDFILQDIEEFSTVIISNTNLLEMLKNESEYGYDDFKNTLRGFITSRDDIEVIDLVMQGRKYSIGATKITSAYSIQKALMDSSGQPVWLPTKKENIEILSGIFDKYYFTLARRIIDFNTLDDYGYLMINMEEVILEQAYKSLIDDENVELFICDKNGVIISHPDKSKIGTTIRYKRYANEVLTSKDNNSYVQYKDKIDKVAIYSTIDSNGWKIIKTISTGYLYEEINNIQKYFLLGGFLYGIVIILFMIFFSIRYTEPMMKMKKVINKVEQGDLTVRTEVHSNDEIGQLGDSLNNMISEMEVLINKLVKEEQAKKEVELEALHAQINPHFLYNTLNTIKWMAKIQGNKSVSRAITALIKLLRISTNLGRDMITLEEEIDYVKNYIVIQKLRFNEAINLNYNIDSDCLGLTVPKLFLQPIVENSIIYGIGDENNELNIEIKAFTRGEDLIIEITDDGPGIEDEILEKIFKSQTDRNKFSKVGLNNVNQRIKLYCGSDYGLQIETKVGAGTLVRVRLNVKDVKYS